MSESQTILVGAIAAGAGLVIGGLLGGSRLIRTYDWDTEWRIDAPLAEVYRVMTMPDDQRFWWPSMQVAHVTKLPDVPGGAIIDYRVRQAASVARLAPPFKIRAMTADVDPERRTRSVVSGDLVGVLETLFASPTPATTLVRFHWYVRVRNPLLNVAGFFLEGMFRASHDHVMREGEAGLNRYLADARRQPAPVRSAAEAEE